MVAGSMSSLAPEAVSRLRLAVVLGFMAVIPDLDVIGFQFGISYAEPLGHRGFTHSILFAMIVAPVVPSMAFRKVAAATRTWWILAGLAFLATISHGVLDAFTDAGLGVGFLIPFDDTRYFAPWRPLATSPLSISAFFDGPAIRILANEFVWVGIPLLGVFGIGTVIRRIGRR
jgi:inner membrane protein